MNSLDVTPRPTPGLNQAADEVMDRLRPRLYETLRDLVQIPSENLPPNGNELACQLHVAERLRALRLEPDVYDIGSVAGLNSHPEFWPGRNYAGRPNVNAVMRGTGGGRSLLLSGHIDTVPSNTPIAWQHPPFGCEVENGRLYGRGAWDMKAGVAMNLTVLSAVRELGWRLKGDLMFETVADEEFAGTNGTLAARVRGYNADAVILGEPTGLHVSPAQRGGRTLHITLEGPGGILSSDGQPVRVMDKLTYVLQRLPEFAERRAQRVAVDPYFKNSPEPFALWVTNLSTGEWGWTQPITVPERCRMEVYWQTMPDETQAEVESEFHEWWNEILASRPDLFPERPVVELPMRWLPGCSIPPGSPLVSEFAETAASLGVRAPVEGLDAPSDMYIFQRCFNTPALLWGPSGGRAHQSDEYVDLESLFQATRVLLNFIPRWCGIEERQA